MTPIGILAAGRRLGFQQWCRQALLPKGVAFVSSCGIVAAQLALVTFEAPTLPPAVEPPAFVVSLVSDDVLRPEAFHPATRLPSAAVAAPRRIQTSASKTESKPSLAESAADLAGAPPSAPPARLQTSTLVADAPASAPVPATAQPVLRVDDVLQRYQDLVWRMIMARRPPAVHLRGAAQIGFHLMANGAPCDIRIVRTSGDPMLDRLAIDTVRRAGPFPTPPAALSADTELEIRFHFR